MLNDKPRTQIIDIADILATGILRMRLRDVRNMMKKNEKTENLLEVPTAKSVHRLEPKQRGEKG